MSSAVFRRLARSAETFAARCIFEAALAATADANAISARSRKLRQRADPNAVRHGKGRAREVLTAQQEALYLTVVRLGCSRHAVGRATGKSHVAVIKSLRAVEDARDDPSYDRELDELELQLMGAA